MPRPALPDWNLDGGVLSLFVNINLDAIRVPPETMNNRCRNKLANKARWEEVLQARHGSWHGVATWIKAATLCGGISLIVMMVDAAGDIASATLKGLSAVPATNGGDGSGLWGTVDYPVRVFLADQAAHLAVAPGSLYAFWQLTGLLGLIGGFLGNAGARIAWTLFGIASLAMIWSNA